MSLPQFLHVPTSFLTNSIYFLFLFFSLFSFAPSVPNCISLRNKPQLRDKDTLMEFVLEFFSLLLKAIR